MKKVLLSFLLFFTICLPLFLVLNSQETSFTKNLHGNLDRILENGKPDNFSFIVFGDNKNNFETLEFILEEAKRKKVLFAIVVGDFVRKCSENNYNFFLKEVKETGIKDERIPLFTVIGNHDLEKDKRGDVYYKYFGKPDYWFSYGNSLFVVIDDARITISKSQFNWLTEILEENRGKYSHIFVFMHIPPFDYNKDRNKCLKKEVGQKFMELMNKYRVCRVFCGHIHVYHRDVIDGTTYIITGGGGA
ncbi:MAG: metallophosphoesterase [Thermodesulfobacteriota bacterium]|nr:metallophosphoesterase [Thermodesulfobacteriota bacterium]